MSWEFDVLYWFQSIHTPFLDKLVPLITALGNGGIFWIIVTLLILIFYKKDHRRMGCMMVLALLLDFVICNLILKNAVARQRPCWIDPTVELLVKSPKDYSFPSGHSAFSFAAATSIFLNNKKWGSAALVLATLIALSRLYLFMHFPTDVIGGACVGIGCALLSCLIIHQIWKKAGFTNTAVK